eukprot:296746-Chlamydomonas_euryale.AAC.1
MHRSITSKDRTRGLCVALDAGIHCCGSQASATCQYAGQAVDCKLTMLRDFEHRHDASTHGSVPQHLLSCLLNWKSSVKTTTPVHVLASGTLGCGTNGAGLGGFVVHLQQQQQCEGQTQGQAILLHGHMEKPTFSALPQH